MILFEGEISGARFGGKERWLWALSWMVSGEFLCIWGTGPESKEFDVASVEYGVGKMADPVAQIDKPGFGVQHEVHGQMAMAENEEVEILVAQCFLCEDGQPLLFKPPEGDDLTFVKTPAYRPGRTQPHSEIRVESRKAPLGRAADEKAFQEFEPMVTGSEAIAVGQKEPLPVQFGFEGACVEDDPGFLGQVVKYPHIVISREQVDRDTAVGDLAQFTQKAGEPLRDDPPVLVPEIENIP